MNVVHDVSTQQQQAIMISAAVQRVRLCQTWFMNAVGALRGWRGYTA